jgi:hypothetical protein
MILVDPTPWNTNKSRKEMLISLAIGMSMSAVADRARLVARGLLTAAIHIELLIPCGRPVCSPARLA